MKVRIAVACFLLLAFLNPALYAQMPVEPQSKPGKQEQPVRLNAELIQVHAVVTDGEGKVVTGLTKEDFELLENARPQAISFFALEKIGDEQPAPPKVAPATVAGETKPASPAFPVPAPRPPARTVVLFADMLHLSKNSLPVLKATLKKFVDEQMTGDDLVAIITSTGQLGPLEQFTRDKQVLSLAIDRLVLWNESSRKSLLNAYIGARVLNRDPEALALAFLILQAEESSDVPLAEVLGAAKEIVNLEATRQQATLKALTAVAGRLAELPGQRLIALLSEGFSTMDAGGSSDARALDAAISGAVRAGVIIYALDAGGLKPDFFLGDASLPRDTALNMAKFSTLIAQSRRDPQAALQELARGTGGEAFINTNDLGGKLKKALNDNRTFYTLAFYPSGDKPGAGFRRLTVRVKNHPEYEVRTQKGYQPLESPSAAVAKTPRQKMLDALAAPLPMTGLGVTVLADFLEWERDDAQVSLQAFIDGRGLDYAEQRERRSLSLELAGVIYDLAGKAADSFSDSVAINLLPARARQAEQNGFRYTRRLRLKPGQYQARIAVREPGTGQIGTATAWVSVPDLRKGGLTLSNIAISERTAAKAKEPAAKAGDLFTPKVTQGIRTYRNHNLLVYYFMIYGAPAGLATTADLAMQIAVMEGERAIYTSDWQPVAARMIASNKKGIGVSGQVQLQMPPGTYELHITISRSASHQTAQQSVIFAVEPGTGQSAS